MKRVCAALVLVLAFTLCCASALAEEQTMYGTDGQYDPARADVALAENPSTGYQWTLALSEEGVIEVAAEEFAEDEHEEGMVGVGGIRHWTFAAKKAGEVTATFELLPPGEGAKAETTVSFAFAVTEDEDGNLTLAYVAPETAPTADIALEENASTGYQWMLSLEGEGCVCVMTSYLTDVNTELVGAPSMRHWVFQGVREGNVAVNFSLKRAWEDEEPAQTDTFELNVDADGNVTVLD